MAAGEELLIAESAERDREGLRKLFDSQGYVCTASGDVQAAKDLVQRKFFPVVLVDLDFGTTNGGIEFIRFVQEKSSPTKVVLLSGRRSYEAAVDALRLGVVDIVSKRPDQIQHLAAAVARAVHKYRAGDKEGSVYAEVRAVLEESMQIMFAMGKRIYGGASQVGSLSIKPAILIIDEDPAFLKELTGLLAERPWDVSVEPSGSSGLDKASSFSFQIFAVREELTDLPGQMLIKSAQAQQKAIGLLYSGSGTMRAYEEGRPVGSAAPFAGPQDLVDRMQELVEELASRREERRHMQAFRTEHGKFLKRYADLKGRIESMLE